MSHIIECPHCLTRVLPMQDSTCPACQKNTLDTRWTDPNQTVTRIRFGQVLPRICFNCGCDADRFVTLNCKVDLGGRDSVEARGLLLRIIGSMFGIPVITETSKMKISLRLPRCYSCKNKPELRRFNYEEDWIDLVAHRNFNASLANVQDSQVT